eukprot:symbB.v1.2.019891.t1/scaffold1641.1/size211090/6
MTRGERREASCWKLCPELRHFSHLSIPIPCDWYLSFSSRNINDKYLETLHVLICWEAAREAATLARQESLSHSALNKAIQDSEKGVLCVVKFKDWPDESLSPLAELVEILGPSGTAESESGTQ